MGLTGSAVPSRSSVRPLIVVVAHRIDIQGQGMERLHASLARSMSELYDVHLLTGWADPETSAVTTVHRVPIPARPVPLRFAMFALLASIRLIWLKKRASLIHSCGAIVFNRVDLITIHLCQAAVVAKNQGRYRPPTGSWSSRLNTGMLKWMALTLERRSLAPLRGATAAAVSEPGLGELQKFYPDTPRALTENGVDAELFTPNHERGLALRRSLGVPSEAKVVLAVGGDWVLRGIPLLVAALGQLEQDVELWIVGRGNQALVHSLAVAEEVDGRVKMFGSRNDVADFYRAADVFVLASAYETFSLVLVEAALVGVPIVSTPVGIAPFLLGAPPFEGGLLVDRSVDALAAGLRTSLGDPMGAEVMAKRAESRAVRFTLSQLEDVVRDVYVDLLEARK